MAVCDCHKVTAESHEINRQRCQACGRCVSSCLSDALTLYGRSVTPQEILPDLLEDQIFYQNSGGGVTLSGGEPLCQADFCAELLSLLKGENVNCALDTCGAVPWDAFEKVLPFVDCFLYDFKHPDGDVHRALTGADNALCKDNLRKLGSLKRPVEIRIPMIPGMNTQADVLERAAAFLAEIPSVTAVRLLEYHDLSRSKYRALDQVCSMQENLRITPQQMASGADIFRKAGLKTILPDD